MEDISQPMDPGDSRRLLEQLPPATPLTLERAAQLGGFRSTSGLRMAVRRGSLHATKHSERVMLTTAGDLLNYLRSTQVRGTRRGQPRSEQQSDQEQDAGEASG